VNSNLSSKWTATIKLFGVQIQRWVALVIGLGAAVAVVAIILLVAGSGGDDSVGESASGIDLASEEVALRDKLSLCADEWNADMADAGWVPSQDPAALVTTTPQGQCVVVFSDDTGQLPAWILDRSPSGEWDTFIDSETTDFDARLALAATFDNERLSAPNAWLVSPSSFEDFIEFDPDAPLPSSAQAEPSLLANPETETCSEVVTFTGGTIGDFYLTVEDAAGISCQDAAEITRDFPFFVQEWSCGGDRRMECSKGDVSFTVVRRDGSPSAGSTSPTISEDDTSGTQSPSSASQSDECEYISLAPGTDYGISNLLVTGLPCDEATDELIFWIDRRESFPELDSPAGWSCESEVVNEGLTHTHYECNRGSQTLSFDFS
jgi:hypothetical protein